MTTQLDRSRPRRRAGTVPDRAALLRTGLAWAFPAAALAAAATLWLSLNQAPSYVASMALLATDRSPIYGDLGVPSPRAIDPTAYRAAVTSGPVARSALTALLGRPPTATELRDLLRATHIEVDARQSSSLIRIHITGHDASLATHEVSALATALMAWEQQRSASSLAQGVTALGNDIDGIRRTLARGTTNGQPLTSGQRASLQSLLAQRTRERDSALVRLDAYVAVGLVTPLGQDAAVKVTATHPGTAPKTLLSAAFAFIATLAAVWLHTVLNPRGRSREEILALTGMPVLGELPLLPGPSLGVDPEAVDLLLAMLQREARAQPPFVVGVTASRHPESKRDVSIKLAASLARAGLRTLLVDADLRQPALAAKLGADPKEAAPLEWHLQNPRLDPTPAILGTDGGRSCDFVPTFTPAEFPQELLERSLEPRVASWAQRYDAVVIEGPPALPFADMMTIARSCSAVVLCADPARTRPEDIVRSRELLERSSAGFVGLALTGPAQRAPAAGRRLDDGRLGA